MIALITQGIGFGFAAASTPGPLQTLLISTTLGKGWQRGLVVVLSPLVTDAPIILVMAFLLGQLPDAILRGINIAGGLFVLWLAWGTWKALRSGTHLGNDASATDISRRRTLMQAAGINMLSPGPYIFWGTVTGPLLMDALNESVVWAVAFLGSFYGAFLGSMAVIVIVFDRLRHLDERMTRGILYLTVGVLALLGLQLLRQGL